VAIAALAQQTARVRTIGFLLPGGTRTTVVRAQLEAFRQGLKEYGWIEGQNISIEYRFAEGKEDALAEIAAELVRLHPDVVVAEGTAAIRAAKNCSPNHPDRHGDERLLALMESANRGLITRACRVRAHGL
jgi:putative tryptophan/tyrosine transport system substrate-binding protein